MPRWTQDAADRQVLTVTQLNEVIKDLLEVGLPAVWVTGEVSDLSRPQSGHIYFTLKDGKSQVRAVMWRSSAMRLAFELRDGMELICGGSLDVYVPRGSYQLNVQVVEPQGVGAAQLALRQLHAKLAAEGLFDPAKKRALPRYPRRIAIVTSPTGAAIRDFLEVLRRRWHAIEVLVVPSRVQGEGASEELAAAIRGVARWAEQIDVLVVARGGGSIEDLMSFNAESVVRAIASSPIPVISAVGHEIDVTLADLAADVRALTPTEAAERVVPSRDELLERLGTLQRRLGHSLRGCAAQARARLDGLAQSRSLRRPWDRIHDLARLIDELSQRSARAVQWSLERARERLGRAAGRLEALSPLAVLGRGYSLTESLDRGGVVTRAEDVAVGERLRTRLSAGQVISVVETIGETANSPGENGPRRQSRTETRRPLKKND